MQDRPRILIVEDDPDQRFLYQEFLKREGFAVEPATSDQEARTKLATSRPHAVILDLSVSGLSLLDHIRRTDSLHDLPVLIISGTSATDERLRAEEVRWNHYLEKPTNLTDLAALLRKEIASS